MAPSANQHIWAAVAPGYPRGSRQWSSMTWLSTTEDDSRHNKLGVFAFDKTITQVKR